MYRYVCMCSHVTVCLYVHTVHTHIHTVCIGALHTYAVPTSYTVHIRNIMYIQHIYV